MLYAGGVEAETITRARARARAMIRTRASDVGVAAGERKKYRKKGWMVIADSEETRECYNAYKSCGAHEPTPAPPERLVNTSWEI